VHCGEACSAELDPANECEEPKENTEGMHMEPTAGAIEDIEDDDSFEAKCKELFEAPVDLEQQEKQAQLQAKKMLKKAVRRHQREAIGYGPIRTASSSVGATYDAQAVVPYGASRATFSQRAVSSGARLGREPIGQPPP
jgi:hypothetical protein